MDETRAQGACSAGEHLVWRRAVERRVRHHGVVLGHVEVHQRPERFYRVELMEVEPQVPERPPEGLPSNSSMIPKGSHLRLEKSQV